MLVILISVLAMIAAWKIGSMALESYFESVTDTILSAF